MAKTKLDKVTWSTILRIMIYILQMILSGIDADSLEKQIKNLERKEA